jgi:alanine racemase
VRPGAALYGINPQPGRPNPMKPVIELKCRVLQLRNVPRGATVGYNAAWSARRNSRIAVIAAGYAAGVLRAAAATDGHPGREVLVDGKRCRIVGRVSMDLMAVDVTDLPERTVRRGDLVTVIGGDLNLDLVGAQAGTLGYEVLTSLGRRYRRIYKD